MLVAISTMLSLSPVLENRGGY